MRSRSAPGNSTPTWKRISFFSLPLVGRGWIGPLVIGIAAAYVIDSFIAPNPLLRIVLRCLPVLPLSVWTLWFDRSRPLENRSRLVRSAGRVVLLVVVMSFAVLLLGLGLNWLYDPGRVT